MKCAPAGTAPAGATIGVSHRLCLLQTLEEREALLAQAEQTTRQEAEQLEDRRRQTQQLVAQAQLQETLQVGTC